MIDLALTDDDLAAINEALCIAAENYRDGGNAKDKQSAARLVAARKEKKARAIADTIARHLADKHTCEAFPNGFNCSKCGVRVVNWSHSYAPTCLKCAVETGIHPVGARRLAAKREAAE